MPVTLKSLTPESGRIDSDGLRAFDAEALARCAADAAQPWWRRNACAAALEGRVPERWVPVLLDRVRDAGDTGSVRLALLRLLAGRPELLPWLRDPARRDESAYGMPEAVLEARAALGDLTAVPELATLAFSPWHRRRLTGEAGLDVLAGRYGAPAVRELLDGGRPEDRAYAVRMLDRVGGDVTPALADPDPAVAYLAQSLLTDPDRLRRFLTEGPGTSAALWAAYALHRLTGDAARTRELYEELGRPRVDVPGMDEELRAAVLHEYGAECEAASDPRWRIETLCAEPPAPVDVAAQLRRATAALGAAGLRPRPPLSCGEAHRQGGGTYHVIGYGDEPAGPRGDLPEVHISDLGRFAAGHGEDPAVRGALEAAGFRWIDDAVGDLVVTGLGVYFFGHRNPLSVRDLLFYWQD
ncbi:hypothetical protein ACIQUQ_05090 [Streptomyces sp. NPDC101118]|uniref:hypothetical protein n=1 Tax=Streptomyces sp. NPDC101118 TaxID=3366109 RepID=UPI0038304710